MLKIRECVSTTVSVEGTDYETAQLHFVSIPSGYKMHQAFRFSILLPRFYLIRFDDRPLSFDTNIVHSCIPFKSDFLTYRAILDLGYVVNKHKSI